MVTEGNKRTSGPVFHETWPPGSPEIAHFARHPAPWIAPQKNIKTAITKENRCRYQRGMVCKKPSRYCFFRQKPGSSEFCVLLEPEISRTAADSSDGISSGSQFERQYEMPGIQPSTLQFFYLCLSRWAPVRGSHPGEAICSCGSGRSSHAVIAVSLGSTLIAGYGSCLKAFRQSRDEIA